MKTYKDHQRYVSDELAWEPTFDAADIGVTVEEGVVTLTGHVPSFAEKWTAEHVVKRVAGVRAVADEIAVRLPGANEWDDADIARAALQALEWDVRVPHQQLTLTVSGGWVTLEGAADTRPQKLAAKRVIATIAGVKGVSNLIKVVPKQQATDVKAKITSAFQRSALLNAHRVQIDVIDRTVILRGHVRTWAEYEAAEQIAWAAPGVAEVENAISVQPAMMCPDKLAAYLRDNQISYEAQHHSTAYTAQGVASSEHLPGHMVAKVVMAVADGKLVMLVLPADLRADLSKVRTALNARELWLADEPVFARRFPDCDVGAMPPFGNLYDLPVYVDHTLAHNRTIVFQAGTHTDTIRIRYADFAQLVKPIAVDIAQETDIAVG
jgi:osmotically-inducible protein OsmY/prolyl-tRNA editing enzyme YbaK/EbsC (Cys-tRNA(Pro) deacylase)